METLPSASPMPDKVDTLIPAADGIRETEEQARGAFNREGCFLPKQEGEVSLGVTFKLGLEG